VRINNLVSCAAGARDAQVEDLDVLSSVLSVFVWTQSWRLCQEMADGCDTLWGMQAVRAVWVYHITWFVNSASHVWGTQVWNTGDLSRNNWLVSTVIPLISSMHTVPSKVLV
jgi:fatty-acid desaturase